MAAQSSNEAKGARTNNGDLEMSGEPTRAVIVLTALLFVLASPAGATIEIGFTDGNEERPAVVFNSVNGEYLVAWRETIGASGIMVQRVSKAGAILGLPITVLEPAAPALATGRPAGSTDG